MIQQGFATIDQLEEAEQQEVEASSGVYASRATASPKVDQVGIDQEIFLLAALGIASGIPVGVKGSLGSLQVPTSFPYNYTPFT